MEKKKIFILNFLKLEKKKHLEPIGTVVQMKLDTNTEQFKQVQESILAAKNSNSLDRKQSKEITDTL